MNVQNWYLRAIINTLHNESEQGLRRHLEGIAAFGSKIEKEKLTMQLQDLYFTKLVDFERPIGICHKFSWNL